VSLSPPSNTPYINIDLTRYQRSCNGTYSHNQKFDISVTEFDGDSARR
jgi:hypothetical protein